MKTAEPKTATVASATKASQPFFAKEGVGSFFKEDKGESAFFKPSAVYTVNGSGVLQTKLTVGQPNDKYEQEADAMADKVMQRMTTPGVLTKKETAVQAKPPASSISPLVQTKCAHCEEEEEKLQKKEMGEDALKKVQRKPIFENNTERDDNENNIRRKCAECREV